MADLSVAVIGLGVTGLSCVNFLQQQGYQVTVFDTRDCPPGIDQLNDDATMVIGPLNGDKLAAFPVLIVSPGIALSTPALQIAAKAGVEIIGDIELFARELQKSAYQDAKLVTITGSNGKTTVTSLLGEMAKEANIEVAVGGNIGVPALQLLSPNVDLYILELSSFQLETTKSLNADIATILNISEDHLDRYESFQHYAQTKQIIYAQSQCVLFNRDDPLTFPEIQNSISFGFDEQHYGLITDQQNNVFLSDHGKAFFAISDLKLTGKHNWMNALAAYALGKSVAIPSQAMLSVLTKYAGLTHRCEFVGEINGVRWLNDSKATNIGATQAALTGLSSTISGKVHVILGGDGKGADFNELSPLLNDIKGVIACFGKDAEKILKVNEYAQSVADLPEAVQLIANNSEKGDLVILSPACASIDMYKNFMERGEHFKTLVHGLDCHQ